jgi:hypothetical protein
MRAALSPGKLTGAIAAIMALVGLFLAAIAVAAPQAIGIAAAVVNDVRIKGAASPQFQHAVVRQRVALADEVRTGEASALQLLLLDRSKFSVGPNARLTIDRFVYDPRGGSLSASIAKGAFRFMSGRASAERGTTIKSPAATIGIRGTILDGVVGEQALAIARNESAIPRDVQGDPETATLVVLRGPGPRTQGDSRVGAASVTGASRTVELDGPSRAAYVPRAGAEPIGPFTISLPGLAWLDDLIVAPPERLPAEGATPLPIRRNNPPPPDFPPPPGAFGEGQQTPQYGAPGLPIGPGRFPPRGPSQPTPPAAPAGAATPAGAPTTPPYPSPTIGARPGTTAAPTQGQTKAPGVPLQ